jgi:hypothetical protein
MSLSLRSGVTVAGMVVVVVLIALMLWPSAAVAPSEDPSPTPVSPSAERRRIPGSPPSPSALVVSLDAGAAQPAVRGALSAASAERRARTLTAPAPAAAVPSAPRPSQPKMGRETVVMLQRSLRGHTTRIDTLQQVLSKLRKKNRVRPEQLQMVERQLQQAIDAQRRIQRLLRPAD